MSNRHQKTSKSGGFIPPFKRNRTKSEQKNGYFAENKGFLDHFFLDFSPNRC